MKKHYKNIQLHEDGFTAEYFKRHHKRSLERARRWTEKRVALEDRNPLRVHYLFSLVAVIPIPILIGILWRAI